MVICLGGAGMLTDTRPEMEGGPPMVCTSAKAVPMSRLLMVMVPMPVDWRKEAFVVQ